MLARVLAVGVAQDNPSAEKNSENGASSFGWFAPMEVMAVGSAYSRQLSQTNYSSARGRSASLCVSNYSSRAVLQATGKGTETLQVFP
jgi:hypothetical protein